MLLRDVCIVRAMSWTAGVALNSERQNDLDCHQTRSAISFSLSTVINHGVGIECKRNKKGTKFKSRIR